MRLLVTGGAGFIGSALIRHVLQTTSAQVMNVDKLTYAGNLEALAAVAAHPGYHFQQLDICDSAAIRYLFKVFEPTAVIHLAAESHVDRSIEGPAAFIQTNIVGTFTLLEAARDYWDALPTAKKSLFRFHHVSTDEVYGTLGETGCFTETTPYQPNSPYSASKAASDHLVRAWHHTYGLPVLVTNCSNNYGPYQFPDKLIPLMILKALAGEPLPVYGQGSNVRDWLYVEDHARALWRVLTQGEIGQTYNIGGHNQRSNLQVVKTICERLDHLRPNSTYVPHADLIRFVPDRPGHDWRYAIDASKLQRELGWTPQEDFDSGLDKTIQWYLAHPDWCQRAQTGIYSGERLGARA